MLNPNCSLGVVSFVCAWSVASHRRKTSRSQERIDRVMVVGLYQSVSYVSNHKDTETQRQSGSRVRSCLDDEPLCLCVSVSLWLRYLIDLRAAVCAKRIAPPDS